MMAEALITEGVALARLGRISSAHVIFRQAIEAAHQVNALNIAGLAALTLIEEIQDLSPGDTASCLSTSTRVARKLSKPGHKTQTR